MTISIRIEPALTTRGCPITSHHNIEIITEVNDGKTVISKSCATCGRFISQTRLPVERPRRDS